METVEHLTESHFFHSCSHPFESKQQLARFGAVAHLVQPYLLGSNCALTWRETEYYSHAGKQITVTSLASRWLYLSHVQMEFDGNKLVGAAEWVVWMSVCVCEFPLFAGCLSTSLSPQQLSLYTFSCISQISDVKIMKVKKKEAFLSINKLIYCSTCWIFLRCRNKILICE